MNEEVLLGKREAIQGEGRGYTNRKKKTTIGGTKECRSSRREARAQEEENMGIERRKEKWLVIEKGERGREEL